MTIYRDTESGTLYTENELKESYLQLLADGETESATFAEYLKNCLSKNGFLERI